MPAIKIWSSPASTSWQVDANWAPVATIPNDTDSIYFDATSVIDLDTALNEISTGQYTSFNQDMSYTGLIGLEGEYLYIQATTTNLGLPTKNGASGAGSRRLNLSLDNSGAILNIYNSATTAADTNRTPILILGTALVVNVSGGISGFALSPTETTTIATLKMTQGAGAPSVFLGSGVTLTTGHVFAGTLTDASAAASTITLYAGATLNYNGTGGFTSLNVLESSTAFYNGTGTIATLKINGKLDMSLGVGAVTVTNCTMYAGGEIFDPNARLTFSNPISLVQCSLADCKVNTGPNRTIQFV